MLFVAGDTLAGEPDLANGEEINITCAGCHGASGQGGKQGEYPRLAGLSANYIAQQLRSFRDRKRHNMPMVPFTEPRELPDQDIEDISAYLASIELPNRPPEFKPTDDALTRLTLTSQVMQIPRAPGDIEKGADLYKENCSSCHKKDGSGKGLNPALRGQYTEYLTRQTREFLSGARVHDKEDPDPSLLKELSETDLRDILAYLSTLDD